MLCGITGISNYFKLIQILFLLQIKLHNVVIYLVAGWFWFMTFNLLTNTLKPHMEK